MEHIRVPDGLPGILGPMAVSPESTKALRELVERLLPGPNTLTSAERELIATYVSFQNNCCFCQLSHGAAARSACSIAMSTEWEPGPPPTPRCIGNARPSPPVMDTQTRFTGFQPNSRKRTHHSCGALDFKLSPQEANTSSATVSAG